MPPTVAEIGLGVNVRVVGAAVRSVDSPSSPSSGEIASPPESGPAGGRNNGALVLLAGLGPEVGAVECFNSSLTAVSEVGPMVPITGEGVLGSGGGSNGSGVSMSSGASYAGDSVSCSST